MKVRRQTIKDSFREGTDELGKPWGSVMHLRPPRQAESAEVEKQAHSG